MKKILLIGLLFSVVLYAKTIIGTVISVYEQEETYMELKDKSGKVETYAGFFDTKKIKEGMTVKIELKKMYGMGYLINRVIVIKK